MVTKDREQMITLAAASKETGIPLRTIQRAAKLGHLEVTRLSSHVVFTTRAAVYRWASSEYKRASRVKKS